MTGFFRKNALRLFILLLHAVVLVIVLGWNDKERKPMTSRKPVGIQLAAPSAIEKNIDQRQKSKDQNTSSAEKPPNASPATDESVNSGQKEEPAWKARSPEDIRKQGVSRPDKPSSRSSGQASTVQNATQKLVKRLKKLNQNVSVQSADTGRASDSDLDQYYSELHNYLYRKWNPPAQARLSSGQDGVDVRLSIARDGAVLASNLQDRSGNKALDRSVIQLLKKLSAVPAFAPYGPEQKKLSVVITFRVDDA